MQKWKEFRFKIEGKTNGIDMTPTTTPMSRLLEYLTDLALVLGHKESVHLIGVAEGSAAPVVYIDPAEESRIMHRMQSAKSGTGPREANLAYRRIDERLREDDGVATLLDWDRKAEVLQFPGKNLKAETIGPIREHASVAGRVIRVGGLDETVPIWLRRTESEIFYCEADANIAKQIAPLYEKPIRVHGIATWTRNAQGVWKLDKLRIQSFDTEPLSEEGFADTIEKLRTIPGNDWATVEDPLEELRKLRHGEDKLTQ